LKSELRITQSDLRIAGQTAPSDGMPDAWETAHGLSPNDPADGPRDLDADGYTDRGEYLNSLIP